MPHTVDMAAKPAQARALMGRTIARPRRGPSGLDARRRGRRAAGPRRRQRHHLRAGVAVELELLSAAEQREAEAHERVADPRPVRHGGDAELDLARVEPLPDLVLHLAALEVAVQRPVVPAPDAHRPPALLADLVGDLADAHAEAEVEADEARDEQHVAALERRVLLEDRVDRRAVGEAVVAHERAGDLERA